MLIVIVTFCSVHWLEFRGTSSLNWSDHISILKPPCKTAVMATLGNQEVAKIIDERLHAFTRSRAFSSSVRVCFTFC